MFDKIIIYFLTLSCILLLQASNLQANDDKYLVIHIDGISSELFAAELEAGNLNNLKETFRDKGMIEHGITYFPPSTQVVISRIREAKGIEEAPLLDWAKFDEDEKDKKGKIGVYGKMRDTISRRPTTNFAYGYPLLSNLAGPALLNTPDLIDKYGIVEFYWFNTDTYAHIWGEEVQVRKLREFDNYFGAVVDDLSDNVNIIIYSDHGMSFGETINLDSKVYNFFEEDILKYAYPNLYLDNSSNKFKVAQKLIEQTPLTYTFVKNDSNEIIGYHQNGQVIFKEKSGRVKYLYKGEDPFNYYNNGYQGEYLTSEQWMELTYQLEYPLTPIRINDLFKHPNVGDIVTVLNPPKIIGGLYTKSGNHHGLTAQDMTVPVLLSGPDLEHLYDYDYLSLDQLFEKTDTIDFHDIEPDREEHSLSIKTAEIDDDENRTIKSKLELSPAYRFKLGGERMSDSYQAWGLYDLYSTYLSRLWLGAGLKYQERIKPMAKIKYQVKVRNAGLKYSYSSVKQGNLNLFYQLTSNLDLKLYGLTSFGFRYSW